MAVQLKLKAGRSGVGRRSQWVWPGIVFGTAAMMLTPLLGFNSPATASGNTNLAVTIDGLNSQEGNICLALFASGQDFPMRSERAIRNECFKVSGQTMQVTLRNLPPGTYAIAALHDANGDHQANRNRLGMPTEGFGFSQNPRFGLTPPTFEEACFRVGNKGGQVSVQMRYLLGGR